MSAKVTSAQRAMASSTRLSLLGAILYSVAAEHCSSRASSAIVTCENPRSAMMRITPSSSSSRRSSSSRFLTPAASPAGVSTWLAQGYPSVTRAAFREPSYTLRVTITSIALL